MNKNTFCWTVFVVIVNKKRGLEREAKPSVEVSDRAKVLH